MTTIKYPGCVRAARNIGKEKKALAEALLKEIPLRRGRPAKGSKTIDEQLAEAAAEIKEETGEVYSVETLDDYRKVAAWVGGNGGRTTPITWANASWFAHRDAYKSGISWADFAKGKRVKRDRRPYAAVGDVQGTVEAIQAGDSEKASALLGEMNEQAVAFVEARLAMGDGETVDPDIEQMMREKKAEQEAEQERIDRTPGAAVPHVLAATAEIIWLGKHEQWEALRKLLACIEQELELSMISAEHLTPEMFND